MSGCSATSVESQIRRACAICCHWCPWAEHSTDGPWTGEAVRCTVNGSPVVDLIKARQCPKDRFPDRDTGLVRRWALTWFGVPAYARWALGRRIRGPVPGCGCTVLGKRAWLWLGPWRAWLALVWLSFATWSLWLMI